MSVSRPTIEVGDALLRWASEHESGSWHQLREATADVLATAGARERAATIARRLSDLGHLDLDWTARRWSVAPPVLAVSPGMGMCAYLAGWRTAFLINRYRQATDDLDIFPFEVTQHRAPTAYFAKAADVDVLVDLADQLHVPVVWDPSSQLSMFVELPALDNLQLGAPPPADDSLQRLDPLDGAFHATGNRGPEGLYRFDLHGLTEHRLLADGQWRIVDRATGMAHVLRGESIIVWHKASADLRTPRAMTVPRWLTLPEIAARAAVAATGLLPVTVNDRRVYRNVSHENAATIAESLGLTIEAAHAPLPTPGAH
jgi:hypothetical protein